MSRTWRIRTTLAAVLTAVALVLTNAATVTPASASATVCTRISGIAPDHMCTYINGSGRTVNYARISVRRTVVMNICNYHGTFTVYNSSGTRIWTATSARYNGCLLGLFATRTIGVGATFPNNSRACGSWFQDGSRLGTSCATIRG